MKTRIQASHAENAKLIGELLFGKEPMAGLTAHDARKLDFVIAVVAGTHDVEKHLKTINKFLEEARENAGSISADAAAGIIKGVRHIAKLYDALHTQEERFPGVADHLIAATIKGGLVINLGGDRSDFDESADSILRRKLTNPSYVHNGVDRIFLAADIPDPSRKDDKQQNTFGALAIDLLTLYSGAALHRKPLEEPTRRDNGAPTAHPQLVA